METSREMNGKVSALLSVLTLCNGRVIETSISPTLPISLPHGIERNFGSIAPAPVYEPSVTTHELKPLIVNQQALFTKALDSDYSNLVKEYKTDNNIGFAQHPQQLFHAASGPHPQAVNSLASAQPLLSFGHSSHAVSHPSSFITHSSEPVSSLQSRGSLIVTPGLSTYSSLSSNPEGQAPVKVIYSDAPVVSHMSFTGLGTNYSW